MGRFTETVAYLSAEPKDVAEIQKSFTHITVDDTLKKMRKEMKVWKKVKENSKK
jgi:hypothetical protein